jgi:hypothetical protein
MLVQLTEEFLVVTFCAKHWFPKKNTEITPTFKYQIQLQASADRVAMSAYIWSEIIPVLKWNWSWPGLFHVWMDIEYWRIGFYYWLWFVVRTSEVWLSSIRFSVIRREPSNPNVIKSTSQDHGLYFTCSEFACREPIYCSSIKCIATPVHRLCGEFMLRMHCIANQPSAVILQALCLSSPQRSQYLLCKHH